MIQTDDTLQDPIGSAETDLPGKRLDRRCTTRDAVSSTALIVRGDHSGTGEDDLQPLRFRHR
jgi:hypothetical protein